MNVSEKDWNNYIGKLAKINETAANEMQAYIDKYGFDNRKALIDYAHALTTKYGETSAELACQMYDAITDGEGVLLPSAEPAATATYGETAKAINGAMLQSTDGSKIQQVVARLVKQAGADSTLKNVKRDNAEWAWIPSGDTCVFCTTLASNGWLPANKAIINGDHADHIHAHCDCTFAIRHNYDTSYSFYHPEKYLEEYENAEGKNSDDKINYIRRKHYQENKDVINAQKRAAYAKRMELKSQK